MKNCLNSEELNKIHQIELDALLELDRICRKYHLVYFLAYGSLIGAVRHHGFIPWDDDIDVCMMRKDYIKFKEICKKELDKKYFYQSHDTDSEYYHLFDKIRINDTVFKETYLGTYNIHHGIFIDIFPVDIVPDNRWQRWIQYGKFHFFRTGLMAKYLVITARKGWKKIAAFFLKAGYALFSLDYLYNHANKAAIKYNGCGGKYARVFSGFKVELFKIKYYTEVMETSFEGKTVLIPKRYDSLLRKMYGNYMELPPKNKRKTEHDLLELKI